MKLDGILLPEFADDLLGDESSRFALERSAARTPEPTITVPEMPGYDGADVVAALELAELQDLLCGVVPDRVAGDLGANEFRKTATVTGGEVNPRTGRRWGTTGFTAQQRRDYCAKFR
jgi:hypothetical protein